MPELNDWSTSRLLTTAARIVEHSWNEKLLSIGITHAGLTTLGVLEREGTLTGVRLAQLFHVQAQTVGRTLDRLVKRGLVTRPSVAEVGRGALTCSVLIGLPPSRAPSPRR